jgi:hypothetical protein
VASFSIKDPRLEVFDEQAARIKENIKIWIDLIFMAFSTLL